ncbi:MAG: DUF4214 domain-containing protein, partial [Cyanobacteria bacterium HKST-UBA05]|nr:DUF4214 domain-containing protein [Cyanobacteria bacterium HKST-UBA05]
NQTTNTEPVLQTAHQDPVTAPPLQAVDPNDPNVAYHVRVTDYAYRDDNNVERHQLNYYFSTDGGHGFSSGSSKKSVYADMADYHLQRGNLEAASFFHDLAALNLDQNGDGQVDFQEVTSQLGTTITNETIAAFQAGQALPTTGVRPAITRSTSFDRAQASATETQEHVYALFEGLLGREPEADQSNYWISQINAGQLSLDEVAARLLQSAGFATYGDQTLRRNMSLYGAPETVNYTGFATELYHAFLGRAPENDAVVATWANQIREKEQALLQEQRDQGVTYPDTRKARALAFGQAVANFIRSNEFQALMG